MGGGDRSRAALQQDSTPCTPGTESSPPCLPAPPPVVPRQGRLLMTHPTKAIFYTLLQDFVRVSAGSADEALYTEADLDAAMARAEVIDFDQTVDINGIQVRVCVCACACVCVCVLRVLCAFCVLCAVRARVVLRRGPAWNAPLARAAHPPLSPPPLLPGHRVSRGPRAGRRHVHGRHRGRAHAVHGGLQPGRRQAPAGRGPAGPRA